MGGGNVAAQNRIWAIFDGQTSDGQLTDEKGDVIQGLATQHTWEGTRATDYFGYDSRWVQRGLSYMPKDALNEAELKVKGRDGEERTLFPGIFFTAAANNRGNDETSTVLGSLELSPRQHRILINETSENNVGKTNSFTIKDVPAGYYIWIEAVTNHSNPESDEDKLKFTITPSNRVARVDRNSDVYEADKHIFSYRTSGSGNSDYTITPTRACYIYYIAILDHPLPVIAFDSNEKKIPLSAKGSENRYPYANSVSLYLDNQKVDRVNDVVGKLNFSSDDPTVVDVDNDGNISLNGKGKATITATLPVGTICNKVVLGGLFINQYTLEQSCSASYTIEVTDDNVLTTKQLSTTDGKSQLWTEIPFYDNSSTTPSDKIKLYLGGWKYQKESTKSNGETILGSALLNLYDGKSSESYTYGDEDGSTKKDEWANPKTNEVGKETPNEYNSVAIDGYENMTLGGQNAKCEFLYKNMLLPGDYVIDFKEREGEREQVETLPDGTQSADITDGKGNPFTVPCFGSFVRIEPECDGQVTVYILQNGTTDFDANTNKVLNSINWRPVYIVDEAGNRLSPDNVKAVTKQRTTLSREDESVDVYEKVKDNNGKSVIQLKTNDDGTVMTYKNAMKAYSDSNVSASQSVYEVYQNVFEKYWHRRGDYEQVLDPKITGDGWLVITKAFVKYQFDVKAGKSYYVFSNKSAIGFAGATFLPNNNANVLENNYELTEKGDNLQKILNGKESVMANKVTVYHKFHEGWNSICLPFSITESKMRSIFGSKTTKNGNKTKIENIENYELVMYNGATIIDKDYDKVHFFHHVYQDIIAGYPYMIYIPKDNDIVDKTSFEVKNVTIENVKRPTITTSSQYMPKGSGFDTHANTPHFVFTGVYNPTTVPEGSYLVVSSGIQRYEKVEMPGYRSYLCPIYKSGESQYEVKRIAATNLGEMTYIWDEANPIESIFADDVPENEFAAPSNVYSVSGQLVRQNSTSLDGLPKGIYIVNGKKYFVK